MIIRFGRPKEEDQVHDCAAELKSEGYRVVKTIEWGRWPLFALNHLHFGTVPTDEEGQVLLVVVVEEK